MRMRWPLIGRSEEMQAIQAAISASDVSGIVVYGESVETVFAAVLADLRRRGEHSVVN